MHFNFLTVFRKTKVLLDIRVLKKALKLPNTKLPVEIVLGLLRFALKASATLKAIDFLYKSFSVQFSSELLFFLAFGTKFSNFNLVIDFSRIPACS